jgi:hypothetical protein
MKIYIDHLNLDILPDIMKTFSKYKEGSEEFLQLYSPDGIYLIDQNSTIKLNPVDHDIIILEQFYKEFTIVVDPSFYIVEKVVQIPPEHITKRIKREFFNVNDTSTTNKKSIKLVIESEEAIEPASGFNFFNQNTNDYGYIPKDIYFELPNGSDIKDALVKENLIVFLSLLN